MRNPHGYVTIVEPGKKTIEYDTFQCVHCGNHNIIVPGSGTKRGWCQRCGGPTCGPQCAKCLPFEKWLDMIEKKGRISPSDELTKIGNI